MPTETWSKMMHPDDDNGDVLRRMEANGDDLSQPRNIDFTVVFQDRDSAGQFAEHFRDLDHKVSVEEHGPEAKSPWDVVVVKYMTPTYEEIGDFETALQEVADPYGGHNDGWGCFNRPKLM